MIEHYELRKVNKEKVLILYLSFDYEFASDFDNKNILDKINFFIKEKRIKWKGNKVILVVGGLVLGSLILGKIKIPESKPNKNFNYVSNIVLNHFDEYNNEIGYSNIEIKDPVIIIEEEKKDTIKVENNVPNNNSISVNNNAPTLPKKEETIDEENNKVMVSIHRSNGNIEEIELEEYVIGVVAAEMPAAFNKEALKAQSVAARTYALKSIQEGTILTDNEKTQSYKDIEQLKELWGNNFDTYFNKIKNAVNDTKGQALIYNGEYIEALYHSTSNGYTEDSYEVFGNKYPYLVIVDSIWDVNASSYLRDKTFTFDEINNLLNTSFDNHSIIEILEKTNSGRISRIKIDDNYYSGTELRNLLGLRSTDFDIEINDNNITFTTRGYGHGVGMSQYGANGMGNVGKTYTQILNHYYPKTIIKTVT